MELRFNILATIYLLGRAAGQAVVPQMVEQEYEGLPWGHSAIGSTFCCST